MGWIGCVRCEKVRRDFVPRNFALVRPVLLRNSKATKRSRMHANSTKSTKTSVWVPMGWICAFVAKNSDATSGHELLHQFDTLCTEFCKPTKRSRMHPNSTKHTKTSDYGPMGWIDRVRCENSDATSWHELLH